MTMKQLPDSKILLEILDLARDFEQSTRETCQMSTAIAHKFLKLLLDISRIGFSTLVYQDCPPSCSRCLSIATGEKTVVLVTGHWSLLTL